MIIYKITNNVNGKIYVGQTTKTAEQRLRKHWSEANCEFRPENYFHNALLKYGIDNFTIEVIDTAETLEELNQKEIYWIDKLDATNKDIGYNLMSGGKSGIKNEETKQKISEKKKLNWQDKELAARMKAGLEKATQTWQEICEEKKIEKICPVCGTHFKVAPWEAEKRTYCSLQCANSVNIKKATDAAAKSKIEKTKVRNELFNVDIHEWLKENQELVLKCPANKISTTLIEIQQIASNKYGFSDWRMIGTALCGETSKKKLLEWLKQECKNIC